MKLTAEQIYRLKEEMQEEIRAESPAAWVPVMVLVQLVEESETIEEVKAKYRRVTAPKAKGDADHSVDANKKPQNNPTPTTPCTPSSQDPN